MVKSAYLVPVDHGSAGNAKLKLLGSIEYVVSNSTAYETGFFENWIKVRFSWAAELWNSSTLPHVTAFLSMIIGCWFSELRLCYRKLWTTLSNGCQDWACDTKIVAHCRFWVDCCGGTPQSQRARFVTSDTATRNLYTYLLYDSKSDEQVVWTPTQMHSFATKLCNWKWAGL